MRRLLLAFAVLSLAGCHQAPEKNKAEASPPDSAAPENLAQAYDELPIRRVVLYQNGVGYFEREGEIDSDVITLRIRPIRSTISSSR